MSGNLEFRKITEELSDPDEQAENVIRTLRRFRQRTIRQETCELCSAGLSQNHRHLLEVSAGQIVCSCDPCALRFQSVVGGRYKLIPQDVWYFPKFNLTDQEWEGLALPINLAFFSYSTPGCRMKAFYPSPAGATESLLPLDTWNILVDRNPELKHMKADVEALLANRVREPDYYILPIDLCFELVGLIRINWRGFSGGEEAWKEVEAFFARLKSSAKPLATNPNS
ncbi:MAG: hypothetical protein JO331_03325 [Verrucomicrobia bacterium]|nr:hypothetical protein [Verrucomicrobiota bacterium]